MEIGERNDTFVIPKTKQDKMNGCTCKNNKKYIDLLTQKQICSYITAFYLTLSITLFYFPETHQHEEFVFIILSLCTAKGVVYCFKYSSHRIAFLLMVDSLFCPKQALCRYAMKCF